jgi:hypothetical protein
MQGVVAGPARSTLASGTILFHGNTHLPIGLVLTTFALTIASSRMTANPAGRHQRQTRYPWMISQGAESGSRDHRAGADRPYDEGARGL